jgi:vacuolar-type H+-ATPase subunit H
MDSMDLDTDAVSSKSAGAAAASRVQGIIDAAEATAAEIVSDAEATADRHIQDAHRAAELIRAEALTAAEEHLAAVEQAAARLRSSIESAGSAPREGPFGEGRSERSIDRAPQPEPWQQSSEPLQSSDVQAAHHLQRVHPAATKPEPGRSPDLDGARLVALNMALAGDSREAIDRYLAEHFDLPQRAQLIDEVCAAIEG